MRLLVQLSTVWLELETAMFRAYTYVDTRPVNLYDLYPHLTPPTKLSMLIAAAKELEIERTRLEYSCEMDREYSILVIESALRNLIVNINSCIHIDYPKYRDYLLRKTARAVFNAQTGKLRAKAALREIQFNIIIRQSKGQAKGQSIDSLKESEKDAKQRVKDADSAYLYAVDQQKKVLQMDQQIESALNNFNNEVKQIRHKERRLLAHKNHLARLENQPDELCHLVD
jgi:hypothetical protein